MTGFIISPQKYLAECIVTMDGNGNPMQPAYFPLAVHKYLTNRMIIEISSFNSTDMAYSPGYDNTQVDVIPDSGMYQSAYVTLLREPGNGVPGGDFYKNVPLSSMRRVWNPGNGTAGNSLKPFKMAPVMIDFTTSYVSLTGNGYPAGKSFSVPFLITYLQYPQDPIFYPNVKTKQNAPQRY